MFRPEEARRGRRQLTFAGNMFTYFSTGPASVSRKPQPRNLTAKLIVLHENLRNLNQLPQLWGNGTCRPQKHTVVVRPVFPTPIIR